MSLQTFSNIIYSASVSIGTPPQSFDLALDTQANDLLIPSANCSRSDCDGWNITHRYNASLSSTYAPNGTYHSVLWAGFNFGGFLSSDTAHFSPSLATTAHLFEEWTAAISYTIGAFPFGYAGVLGLAPPWTSQAPRLPNPLSRLDSSAKLPSSLFSLKLPRNPAVHGELLFGATNPNSYASPPVRMPIVETEQTRHGWTVAARNITFASYPRPLHLTLPTSTIAILDSASPWIIVPRALAQNITAAVGAEPGPYWLYNVPCNRRQELPVLTFDLGNGEGKGGSFGVSAFEYTVEGEFPNMGTMCVVSIQAAEDYSMPRDAILLGSTFFRGFYSVWDWGRREVACKSFVPCSDRYTLSTLCCVSQILFRHLISACLFHTRPLRRDWVMKLTVSSRPAERIDKWIIRRFARSKQLYSE